MPQSGLADRSKGGKLPGWTFAALLSLGQLAAMAPPESRLPSNLPVDVEIPTSPMPVTADGRLHAVYELHLTNFSRIELHLRQLDVTDGSGRRRLARYEGPSLMEAIGGPGARADAADRRVIAPGSSIVIFLDVTTPGREPMPSVLSHRLVFEPAAGFTAADTTIEAIRVRVRGEAPIILGPPLRGGGWVASHALSNTSEHRRSVVFVDGKPWIAQRFAIDWLRIGPNGQAFAGDPAKLQSWAPYGASVLAVADGRIVDEKDGITENDPTSAAKAVPINLATAGGNYVILDLGGGRYAFYAHLRPGSLTARIGDRVGRGQVIARLGDSGNADAPHLHFQVMDANAPLAADGLPYEFASFAVEGRLPSLSVLADGKGWRPPPGPPDTRRNALPTENEVIDFP